MVLRLQPGKVGRRYSLRRAARFYHSHLKECPPARLSFESAGTSTANSLNSCPTGLVDEWKGFFSLPNICFVPPALSCCLSPLRKEPQQERKASASHRDEDTQALLCFSMA